MDLSDWVYFEKKKDRSYSREKFAKQIGISKPYLDRIMNLDRPATSRVAYMIEKVTDGKVSGWELIKKYMEKKENG